MIACGHWEMEINETVLKQLRPQANWRPFCVEKGTCWRMSVFVFGQWRWTVREGNNIRTSILKQRRWAETAASGFCLQSTKTFCMEFACSSVSRILCFPPTVQNMHQGHLETLWMYVETHLLCTASIPQCHTIPTCCGLSTDCIIVYFLRDEQLPGSIQAFFHVDKETVICFSQCAARCQSPRPPGSPHLGRPPPANQGPARHAVFQSIPC